MHLIKVFADADTLFHIAGGSNVNRALQIMSLDRGTLVLKIGRPHNIAYKTHPADQMSTFLVYFFSPLRISGGA
jgi:hypothetical protein